MKTLKDLKDNLDGRPVFVTGADGFVGSHVVDKLVELGAEVHALVRATSSGTLRNIEHYRKRVTIHRGDIQDYVSVRTELAQLKGKQGIIVFHLAAQAHVGESWTRPLETVTANVIGTLNLLQACLDLNLDLHKFDTAGTSEEYGNINPQLSDSYDFDEGGLVLHERSPINPKSIYATSKLAADFLTMNFFDAYGIPGVTTRMFNNYGPRQNPRYITGTIITQALCREAIELGNLKSKRDFCYVEDGAYGHLHVALFGNPGEVYTYGYGQNISMEDWARKILDVGRQKGYWGERKIRSVPQRLRPGASDVDELKVGYQKLHELTGWEPQTSWEEGIMKTIEWYANNKAQWISQVDWN